ncbi:MAG: hypothetical protein QOH17_4217 [Pseudonocardiales bacterium]|jgi:hypothetical protein|nr:hypothetical protein [Pseudonocardiales bacterium]
MDQHQGLPARELSDAELERQGTRAHATRNWVFLHGTADQFRHHTERMLELEQEYLRRFPKRTWQGATGGGVGSSAVTRVEEMRQILRSFQTQMDGLLAELAAAEQSAAGASDEPVAAETLLLARFAAVPDGRMHKLEAHQAARELGLHPADVARLYKQDPPLLATAGAHRFITDAGRAWLTSQHAPTA